MINQPIVTFLNTQGVVVLVVFVLLYEVFVVKKNEVALHALLSVVSVIVFTIVLKELFLIPRPYLVTGGAAYAGLSGYSSLPSTHTAIAFGLATSIALHQKRLGVFLFTIASLIGIGRVAAHVHYPMDIIIGILVGVLTAVIFNQIHISYKKRR